MAAVMPEVLALLGVNVVLVLESVVNAVVVVESVVNPVMILVRSVALPESPLPEEDVLSDDVPKSQVLINVLEDDPGACSVMGHIHINSNTCSAVFILSCC